MIFWTVNITDRVSQLIDLDIVIIQKWNGGIPNFKISDRKII